MRKLSDDLIHEIAEDLDMGMFVFLNVQTEEAIPLPNFEMNPYADADGWEDSIQQVEEQEKHLVRFEPMPSFQAFKTMESFAEQVEDAKIKERLSFALNKNKPFKNFKYELDFHSELRDEWFKFKQKQYELWVQEQWEAFLNGENDGETDFDNETLSSPSSDKDLPTSNGHILISSGAPWEDIVGYSRAVRVGNIVEVAGTTAVDEEGNIVGLGDIYAQTKFILSKIEKALEQAGAELSDVVRTRIFVTDITQWEAVGKAHGEFFATIKPASTMLGISALVNPDMLVEIEVTAIL